MSIDGLSSINNTLYQQSSTTKTDALESSLSQDLSSASDEKLMDVCKDFESYFTEQMFKAMKKMVPESEDSSSTSTLNTFEDMLYKEYADSSTEGQGIGIAQMLFEQMKRNYGSEE